jgi:hypothetical protein
MFVGATVEPEARPFTVFEGTTVEPVEVRPFTVVAGTAVETAVEFGITVWDEAGVTTEAGVGVGVCVFWLTVFGVAVLAVACGGTTFLVGTVVVVCAPAVQQTATAIAPAARTKV